MGILGVAPGDVVGFSIGAAAVLLVLGWVGLAWQRDRHRFLLMKTALEKGINHFPDAPPYWLLSLRQGVTVAALGIALTGVGAGAWWHGSLAPEPSKEAIAIQKEDLAAMKPLPRVQPTDQPAEHALAEHGPGGPRPHPDRLIPPPRQPLSPNPEVERWRQGQTESTLGLVATGVGIILGFVGIVRVFFAQAEKQYATEQSARENG